MILTSSNYHGLEANKEFWSVSLFKAFDRCEASGLASVRGQYEREQTDALLTTLAREELIENGNWSSYERDNAPEISL